MAHADVIWLNEGDVIKHMHKLTQKQIAMLEICTFVLNMELVVDYIDWCDCEALIEREIYMRCVRLWWVKNNISPIREETSN